MKIAVSGMAFRDGFDPRIMSLRGMGVVGVEASLAKIAPWELIDESAAYGYAGWLAGGGLFSPSIQSLFHGSGIGSFSDREPCLAHLLRVISLASSLGSRTLVLGSPRMRTPGSLADLAHVLCRIDPILQERGMVMCLEPNCRLYGGSYFFGLEEICDFIYSSGLTNVMTMVDTSNLLAEGLDPAEQYYAHSGMVWHVHYSSLNMRPLEWDSSHISLTKALCNYGGFVTYELGEREDPLTHIKSFVDRLNDS